MPNKKTRGISNLPVAIPDVPDAPTVSATNVGTSRAYNNGAATVSITSPTGGLPSSYSITTSPSTVTTTATSSPVTLTGLSSATAYTATVTPTNVSATGAATTSSSFTATTVPQAPTIGTFTDGGTGTTGTLSFTAGATGGSSITGYTYSTDGTNYSAASGTTSPFSLTGLSVGTYTFYLKATNANGTSLASTGVSGTVVAPSSYESIATVTGTGSAGSLTFSSIPSTYVAIQIRGIYKDTSTTDYGFGVNLLGRANSITSGYTKHNLYGNGSSASATAGTSESYVNFGGCYMSSGSSYTSMFSPIIIDIHNYASTTQNKTIRYITGNDANESSTNRTMSLGSILIQSTTAISSFTLYPADSGFAAGSTFALYGIKG